MTNRAALALRAPAVRAAALAGATVLVSGCAVFSPVQTDVDYPAADGVRLSMDGLELRNLALVLPEEGATGVVIGQAVNTGTTPVDVSFAVEGAPTQATAAVPVGSGATLSDSTSKVEIDSVPAAPGDTIEMTVSTPDAGQNLITVPVLAATGYYESLVTAP